jgi:outer membrane protein TolC
MGRVFDNRAARRPFWLLMLVLGGCASSKDLYTLVVPEQTQLEVREPAQIPGPSFAALPPPVTVSNPLPPSVPAKDLSLDEAIHIALANAQAIRVLAGTTATSSGLTIYDPAISNTDIDVARAVFDPTLSVKNTWNQIDTPTPFLDPTRRLGTSIFGTTTDLYDVQVGLSKRNVLGGTVGFTLDDNNARFRPGLFPLNPQQQSSLALTYTQPLLKGAGVSANVAPIVIARIDTERTWYQLKDSVQELVRSVVEAYWDVVFARTDVWTKRQQVEQGQFAYDRAEARKKQGIANAAEVAQTRVSLFNFKASLVAAEANLLQVEDLLRNLLRLPPNEPLRIAPVTPPLSVRVEPRWEETLKLAEVARPDLVELRLTLEADQEQLVLARNQAQPQLDASLAYGWTGLSGTTPSGVALATGAGQFTNWTLGLNLSMPLGLRQGRAAMRRAELMLMRDRANLDQALNNAVHELAGTFRSLAQQYELYVAYRQTRQAARENLEQQLADWRSGRSIYLNVLQAISDWGNAVSSEAQALARYNVELANLERETGTILETHGVTFMEERYNSRGPLGRLGHGRLYPEASAPGPNAPRYPVADEPSDARLERERPALPKLDGPVDESVPGHLLAPHMP